MQNKMVWVAKNCKIRQFDKIFFANFDVLFAYIIYFLYDFSNPSTKLLNRELGGLTKASQITHCDNLTLIVMYGETGTIEHNDKKIRVVSASEWLVNQ